MGWVWRDDSRSSVGDVSESINPRSGDRCSTRKIVKSQCRTEEVEPGRFVKKCEKTEEILRECVGMPVEVLKSDKEYTEEDITDQVVKGSFPLGSSEQGPFEFPGLRNDIEAIERSFIDGLNRFFDAADGMKDGVFSIFDRPRQYDSSFPHTRRGIPVEEEAIPKASKPLPDPDSDSGHIDLSGLARDV